MSDEITVLLRRWSDGDAEAMEQLTPLVYQELKLLSARIFRTERPGHTLQPTALVSELYEKLIGVDVRWADRNHFFALSAQLMRRILVTHARKRNAAKRGGGAIALTLHDGMAHSDETVDMDILTLDQALSEFAELDERKAQMLELHYFGGLTHAELAEVMDVGASTVYRDLRVANAWLKSNLKH